MHKITVGDWRPTQKEKENVQKVLDTGRLSYGPFSQTFEKEWARIHNCKYAILSNSGTSSLQVAVQSLKEIHGWNDGDEVIVPSVTFCATVNVLLHNRLKPVLVDVDPLTYNIDAQGQLPHVLTKHPMARAVMPVHLLGQPADMTRVIGWAKEFNLAIIEDVCECFAATHYNKPVGSWGDIGCFSTYIAHLITTGVGGLATTNNPDYAVKIRSLVNHGRDGIYLSIDDDDQAKGEELREIVSRRFSFESVGHSYRITELEAAIGCAQLENWWPMIATRRQNVAYLTAGLKDLEDRIQLPTVAPGNTHSWMMMGLVLREGSKWPLCNYLEERGIETREILPLTNQPVYAGMWNPKDYPVAEWINESGFYVGCHQYLTKDDLDFVIEVIHAYFKTQ